MHICTIIHTMCICTFPHCVVKVKTERPIKVYQIALLSLYFVFCNTENHTCLVGKKMQLHFSMFFYVYM